MSARSDEAPWSPASFEQRFSRDRDPWRFERSPYERFRFSTILGALSKARYASGLEPACANGELTALLAERCAQLVAFDVSPTAAVQARGRCAELDHVRILVRDLQEHEATSRHDLVVLSEVGYYFEPEALRRVVRELVASLVPGGDLLAVHWLGTSPDHRLHGDEVHQILGETIPFPRTLARWHLPSLRGLAPLAASPLAPPEAALDRGFRIERWRRPV